MEDTLRELWRYQTLLQNSSLNPCFNGRYSQREIPDALAEFNESVLILVLMEDTLRGKKNKEKRPLQRLNPCFNGRYSQRCYKRV